MLTDASHSPDSNQLITADFLFAAGIHVLIVLLIIILTWWQPNKQYEPIKRIEVQMISPADLKKMQKPKQRQAQPIKRKKKTPASLPSQSKPLPKSIVEDNFDPFAPLESSSNQQSSPQQAQQNIASTFDQQLSSQEKNRYIAMMQMAVQQHWKVPGGISDSTPSPLVEMILHRNGHIASVRIIESSGQASLDQTLLNAIYAAAPFELPRQQFEAFRHNKVRFHPKK